MLRPIFTVVALLLFWHFGQTQSITVTGTVTDGANQPLPGVTVTQSGTKNTTVASEKGSFTIKVPQRAQLLFTAIGYESKEVRADSSLLHVILTAVSGGMDEVVVTGYGQRKRILVTGAIDQVSGESISKRPVANILQGLQGVAAGLNITYPGGRPGATPSINIRGMGSINGGGGGPLILIDNIASQTDDLLRLNPSDIESYSLLKDGGSSAIYGARAAFGVLIITTRKGALGGKQNISYNNYFARSKRTLTPEPITDPFVYKKLMQIATDNTPWTSSSYAPFPEWQQVWAKERSENPSVEDVRVNPLDATKWAYMGSNNWNDYFFAKSNFSQYHNLSISGSSSGPRPIRYLLSADYTKENGLNKLARDDWNRYGLRSNLGLNPLPWLKVDDNLAVYQLQKVFPSYNITDVYYTQPTNVAKNPDGTWANNTAGILAAQLTDGGSGTETRFGFTNNLSATVTALKGSLTVRATASNKRELWKSHSIVLPYQIGYGPKDIRMVGGNGSVTEVNGTVKQDVYDLFGNYTKKINLHAFNLSAVYNQEMYEWSPVNVSRDQLISKDLPYISLTTGTNITIGQTGFGDKFYDYAVRSYFGRLNYAYDNKYIIDLVARRDGSSRFPPQDRWAFTPAVSAAWVVNRERFWEALMPAFSALKLRYSYARQANQSVKYYDYIQTLGVGPSSYLIGGNTPPQVITGAPPLRVDPTNYTWETVAGSNFGVDLGFLKDRLTAGFDYYIRKTTGMLAPSRVLPAVLGTNAPQQNAADMETKGWELSLGYNETYMVAQKPFSLGVKARIWDSRSKILKYDNPLHLFSGAYRPGQVVGEIWGLTNDGIFETKEEIAEIDQTAIIPWGEIKVVPGWPRYKDLDGDKKILRGTSDLDPKDLRVIGNNTPRYRYGFNLEMGWNNIDLSLFLQGVGKMDYYPQHYLFWGPYQQPYANIYPWNLDFYRGTAATPEEIATYPKAYTDLGLANANTGAFYPVLQSWLADDNDGKGLDIPQTKYLLSAAYLRIKNLTVGYTLPQNMLQRFGIERLRIFFTGENIFEVSKIKKFVDPESIVDGYGWAYPYQRKYSVGINVTL
ncbi:SusC/RagA family TonB-linked outer membrane protein [Niabella sp. CC-SYL272]|uniref:SusC/RagA family TonB-linked outer membrane protein n=1 Tax=Niabella agricola TaxID=2891571 RepID=UPI001F177ECF|nr:SusC/RagA family TonB-linked outer membrane protein [Niabella agricola]MCF3111182.1 SusC/RagA family TonB-linked outer membrane protein [Niabella agricola]